VPAMLPAPRKREVTSRSDRRLRSTGLNCATSFVSAVVSDWRDGCCSDRAARLLCEAVARNTARAQNIRFLFEVAVVRGPGAASESALHVGRREEGAVTAPARRPQDTPQKRFRQTAGAIAIVFSVRLSRKMTQ
jgi:hypothetical protein